MSKEDYDFDSQRDEALCAQGEQEQVSRNSAGQLAVYAPHCPACLSAKLIQRNLGITIMETIIDPNYEYHCRSCGLCFPVENCTQLRPLAPQPAPPYTGDELITMAYDRGYIHRGQL